jgi:Caspase domain
VSNKSPHGVRLITVLLTLAITLGTNSRAAGRTGSAAPLVFYASQSGRSTLDQGEGGGNPFASALIELLERPSFTYSELRSDLIKLTKEKSRGFQVPEALADARLPSWRIKPIPSSEKRVALVFAYSDYRAAGVTSLPGAKRDLGRVAAALRVAGFDVEAALNPTKKDLRLALESLSTRSRDADSAIIYLTGHGLERGGQVYLMPNDHRFGEGLKRLSEVAVHVPSLTNFLKARSANIVFFGGCRTVM